MPTDNYIIHANAWYWGMSIDILRNDGLGLIGIKFDDNYPTTAFLCDLTVYEHTRNQGMATGLMNKAFDVARQHKKVFAQLCVDKTNERLVNWYKRWGFSILSKDEHEYTMIKAL